MTDLALEKQLGTIDHLLRIYKRASSTAQPLTKIPNQVAEAGRLEEKPKSSLQHRQDQGEYKIKKSQLAC